LLACRFGFRLSSGAGLKIGSPWPASFADPSSAFRRQQVGDIAWQALEPNTSSHNQAAWEVISLQTVTGRDVQDRFEGGPIPGGCAPGPEPPENAAIALDGSYWYVQMKPRLATSLPEPSEQFSPTAPPNIPEPFVYQADFLVDAGTGQVTARKIYCVIF
jgi:hypothetical protein